MSKLTLARASRLPVERIALSVFENATNMQKIAAGLGSFIAGGLKGAQRLATSPTAHKLGTAAIKGTGAAVKGFGKAWEKSPLLRRMVGTSVVGAGLGAVPGAIGGALAPGGSTGWSGALQGAVGGGVLGSLAGLGIR
jgi:hypothetical protein